MTHSLSTTHGKSSSIITTGSSASQPSLPVDDRYGIDTVAFYMPIDIADCDPTSGIWQYEGSRNLQKESSGPASYVGNIQCGYSNVHLNLYIDTARCRVEFNAARIIYPKSARLLPPGALVRAVELVLDSLAGVVTPAFDSVNEAGEYIRDTDWAEQIILTRLDVTRDFIVSDPATVQLGLAKVQAGYQKTQQVMTSPKGGWSIVNGTKFEGKDTFYDKEAELRTHGIASERQDGSVLYRFESSLKGTRLKGSGMKKLSGVTDDLVWEALNKRWDATGWDTPLPGSTGFIDSLSHLTPTRMDNLIGFLHRCACGMDVSMSKTYLREHNKLARSCGLTPGLPVELLGKADRYLDLVLGEIVPLPKVPPI
jgi:hypothetical protein